MTVAIAIVALLLSAIPASCFLRNIRLYREPRRRGTDEEPPPPVSVLIPARDEEASIAAAVEAAAVDQGTEVEVVVLDDHSGDRTAELVREAAQRHPNVRLEIAPPLPPGWCGKQHACHVLASLARHEVLVFVDADVRLAPGACARMAGFLEAARAGLASGIPRQEVGSTLERLLIPLIHFLVLGFLPIWRMRRSLHPSYGAGCGQLFVTRKSDYRSAGGHAAIRATLHDGVRLPRAYRAAGIATDLFDATRMATCRMYRGARQVWRGLEKNATEGLAAPRLIVPATLLLLGGQVLPFALAAATPFLDGIAIPIAWIGAAVALGPRIVAAFRFEQPLAASLLHPIAVLVLLAIQWSALLRHVVGKPTTWKGRAYAGSSSANAGGVEAENSGESAADGGTRRDGCGGT